MFEEITTFDAGKQKVVRSGIYKNGVFTKRVKPEHLMRKFNAYGVQEDIIVSLAGKNCQIVHIICDGKVLESKFEDWLAPDIKVMDFGNGKQRFLPVNRMIEL